MSAPLVINLRDGSVWERRGVNPAGVALYALAGSCKCPEYLMATEAELAAQGIAGSADVLPVPVGPEPQASERDRLRAAYIEALDEAHRTYPCPVTGRPYWTGCVHYDEAGHVAGVGSCHSERRADAVLAVRDAELEGLRAQVSALLAERQSTNESLDDAIGELRARSTAESGEVFVPRTELSRWSDIAAALNAAHDAGMPVGIDLDGTLTDRLAWSVVWDREAERWAVSGYEDEPVEVAEQLVEWCTGCNTDHDPAECGYQPATGGAS